MASDNTESRRHKYTRRYQVPVQIKQLQGTFKTQMLELYKYVFNLPWNNMD